MATKGILWFITYGALSVASFGMSLVFSASKSYDYLMLMQELTDSFRLVILLNFVVFCFLLVGFISIRLIFQQVRIIEIEHIADQLPFYGLNLLFILFNDDNLLLNMVWTGLILLSKVYHIIAFDRVDFLQVQVVNKITSQACTRRSVLSSFVLNLHVQLLVFLLVADIFMARVLAYDVFQGVSSMGSLLFGIQFGVLGIECLSFLGKLVLNVYELVFYRCSSSTPLSAGDGENELEGDDDDELEEQIWENRALFVQGFGIVTSALKMIFYSMFLHTLFFHSSLALPIPIIQGCIVSIHQTVKQMYQFGAFLSQSRQLDNQLSSPTEDELAAADHVCIICREDMHFPNTFLRARGRVLNPRKHPKKLQCGHILHLCCLKDWLERSESCPLCRSPVFKKTQSPTSARSESRQAPPDAAPVARPTAGNPGPTEGAHVAQQAPTPTSTHMSTISESERSGNVPGASVHSNRTGELSSMGDEHISELAGRRIRTGLEGTYIPKDWVSFAVNSTSDPCAFVINFSPTRSARLRVRSRQTETEVIEGGSDGT